MKPERDACLDLRTLFHSDIHERNNAQGLVHGPNPAANRPETPALVVFASMRPGEALTLRWKDILRDRIVVDERVYDDEFDDVKTEGGKREVPLDKHLGILGAVQRMWASCPRQHGARWKLGQHHVRCLFEDLVERTLRGGEQNC